MPKKKASLGFLFWIAFILLILVVFLFNKSRIETVLDSTGFLNLVKKKIGVEAPPEVKITPLGDGITEKDTGPEPGETTPDVKPVAPTTGVTDTVNTDPVTKVIPATDPAGTKQTDVKPTATEPEKTPATKTPEKKTDPDSKTKTVTPVKSPAVKESPASRPAVRKDTGTQTPADQNTRKTKLYFVLVGDDGHLNLKGAERTVSYKDSPLTATIGSLLSGPNRKDISDGLMSLIPESTRLISATVKDGTAYLNFSEAFRFNKLGMDGYLAQLKQIVYSATEFPTVKNVQFLIEGEKLQYLTAEGIFIGAPLGRGSF